MLARLAVAAGGLIYLISLRQPVFTERYLIWIGPAAILVLALGLRVLARTAGASHRPSSLGFMAYTLVFWTYANWHQKTTTIKYDLRSAVAYIQAHRGDPNALLILQIPHQEWSYRYYSSNFGADPFADSDRRMGRWIGGPYTNYGQPDDQARAAVDALLRPATAPGGRCVADAQRSRDVGCTAPDGRMAQSACSTCRNRQISQVFKFANTR